MLRHMLAGSALGVCATTAQADERPQLSFNVGAASEYVFRGVGQTGGQSQVFGGADVTHGPLYFGAWASNVDYGDGTDAELDLYGGLRRELGGWTLDAGAIAYLYPGQPGDADYDYVEAKIALSRGFGPANLGAAAFWTPDFGGSAEGGTYAELNGAWALTDAWTVSGAAGYQALSQSDADYSTWNLGLSWTAERRVTLDLRVHDTDADAFGPAYESRLTVSLKAGF